MKTAKSFDCVRMKDDIQARLRVEWQGLKEKEIRAKVHEHLATSDGEIAKWWRGAQPAKQEP